MALRKVATPTTDLPMLLNIIGQQRIQFIIPTPIEGRYLSACLTVCPVPDPKSRTEGHKKLKICRNEACDTGDP